MKRIKKLASLLLAMAMVLGMTMTTFAAVGDYNLTIATVKDHTYKIYQLITGDISSDGHTLSNMTRGSNANADVAEILAALTDKNKTHTHTSKCYEDEDTSKKLICEISTDIVFLQAEALGVAAAKFIDRNTTPVEVVGDGTDKTVNLAGGYYIIEDNYSDAGKGHTHTAACYENGEMNGKLICEEHVHTTDCYKDASGNVTEIPMCGYTSLSRVMVTLVQDVKMVPKDTTIAPDKKIVDDVDGDGSNEEVDTNEASIGDTITYKLSGLVPDMQDFYEEDDNRTLIKGNFKFVFVDTMSKGLTPDKVLKCSENHNHGDACYEKIEDAFSKKTVIYGKVGSENAAFQVTGLSTDSTTGVTTIRIALMNAINYRHQKGDKVEVTITAILNQEAVVAPGNNPNDLAIEFSNNSNYDYDGEPDFGNDPHGTTPKVTVATYTTQLEITKVIGNTSDALTGAEFKLSSTNNAKVGYVTGTKYVKETELTDADKLANQDNWYQLVDGAFTKTKPTETTKNAYKDTETIYKEVVVAKPTETPTNNIEAQAFVNSEGKVVFTGLSVGEYKLEEVTVPDGYNKMDDITFKVTWTKEGGFRVEELQGMADGNTITVNGLTINGGVTSGVGNTMTTIIPNFSGSLLPSTGGIGTTIFYIVGGILVIGAGILLVAKKRMSSK